VSTPRTLHLDLSWAGLVLALASGFGCLPASSDLDEYATGAEGPPPQGKPSEPASPPDPAGSEPVAAETGASDIGTGEASSSDGTESPDALPTELAPPASSGAAGEDTEQDTSVSESTTEPEPAVDPAPPVVEPPSAAERCDGVLDPAQAPQTSCYRAVTLPRTWDDARIDCVSWGGSLVQVDSSAEDQFVGELVTVLQWLGASDTLIDNVFVWTNGSPILFGNWGASQPDRFPGADCVEKRDTAGRQWFDQPCYNLRAYVCEKALP